MKKLLSSFYVIFACINIFADPSGNLLLIEDQQKFLRKLTGDPELFKYTNKTCDAEFVLNWFSLINLDDGTIKNDVGRGMYSLLCEELRRNPDVNLAIIRKFPKTLEYIDPKLVPNYDELTEIAVNRDGRNLEYVKPEGLSSSKKYDEITKIVVSQISRALMYVKPEYLSSSKKYDQLAKIALNGDDISSMDQLALTFVKLEGLSNSEVYDKLATNVVNVWGGGLEYVNPKGLSSSKKYDELATTAVNESGLFLIHVKPKALSSKKYDELAKIAVNHPGHEMERVRPGGYLEYVKPEYLSSSKKYDEYARTAVNRDERNLEYVKPEYLSSEEEYDELALFAVNKTVDSLEYIKPKFLSSEEIYDILRKFPDYDQTVMDEMSKNIGYIEDVPKKVVFSLEETKREDLLNYIESSRCNWAENFKNHLFPSKCKYEEKINKWLREYEDYEKEQEAK